MTVSMTMKSMSLRDIAKASLGIAVGVILLAQLVWLGLPFIFQGLGLCGWGLLQWPKQHLTAINLCWYPTLPRILPNLLKLFAWTWACIFIFWAGSLWIDRRDAHSSNGREGVPAPSYRYATSNASSRDAMANTWDAEEANETTTLLAV